MATKRPNNAPETEVPGDKSHKRQRLTSGSAVAFLGENHEPDPIAATATATPEETEVDDGSIGAMQDSTRVAVLVPFRDNHPAQKRRAHLDEFVPYMTEFMQRHCAPKRYTLEVAILDTVNDQVSDFSGGGGIRIVPRSTSSSWSSRRMAASLTEASC